MTFAKFHLNQNNFGIRCTCNKISDSQLVPLINLILQLEKFTSSTACDKLTSLDTVRASKPEIPDPNNRKLPKELKTNCSAN